MDHLLNLTPEQAIPHLNELLAWIYSQDCRPARMFKDEMVILKNGTVVNLEFNLETANITGYHQGGLMHCGNVSFRFYAQHMNIYIDGTYVGVYEAKKHVTIWQFGTPPIYAEITRTILAIGMMQSDDTRKRREDENMRSPEQAEADTAFLSKWS